MAACGGSACSQRPGAGIRSERGRVDEQLRRGDVVAEQRRRLAVGARHRDVEHAARPVEGLQEGGRATELEQRVREHLRAPHAQKAEAQLKTHATGEARG
eukprot:1095225-Pleurochrysis_carterae.AAC.2